MSGKEWREVGRQSLVFILALAAMALLLAGADLLAGALGAAPARPLEGEKIIVILGIWLLMFSLFMGLTPFAMDSKQRGMEYLLTLPLSRRRLLLVKFLPRLAAVAFFYVAFAILYPRVGDGAFAGGFAFFSLAYFALFLISYSLSVSDENFIVQSIAAGGAWAAYLALCLWITRLGFSWRFSLPAAGIGSRTWSDLSVDLPSLLLSISVFLLMATPFVASLFLAFKRFDLRPARAFNRRQLLIFAPLLLLAFAVSLGATYLVQKALAFEWRDFFILGDGRVLKAETPGSLTLYGEGGPRRIRAGRGIHWGRPLLEEKDALFISGYDPREREPFIGRLALADLSWRVLHRCPERLLVASRLYGFFYDGESFVYLRRRPPADPGLDLVVLDRGGVVRAEIACRSRLLRMDRSPRFIGSGRLAERRFWLVAGITGRLLRLAEDGRVEDLGPAKPFPVYAGGRLLAAGDRSLQARRLDEAGSETAWELPGKFSLVNALAATRMPAAAREVYAARGKRLVRIALDAPAVDDLGPVRGPIWLVPPGDYYYVEYESWPGRPTDRWRKLYRLKDGRKILLRRFDFAAGGYGHVWVGEHGVVFRQQRGDRVSFFAFPDLRELKFNNLN